MDNKINEKKSLLREAEKRNLKEHRHLKHGDGFFGRLLTKIIIILILLIILLGGGYFILSKKILRVEPEKESRTLIVLNQLSYCQELVTMKYFYTDIASTKKQYLKAKSYSLVKFTGVIRIGIQNLTDCDFEIYNEGKGLKIKMPDVEILGNDITSQEVFDESHSIFVPITLDEVFTEIEKAKQGTLEDLISDGILKDARENAKRVIQQIMMAAGFEEVIVV